MLQNVQEEKNKNEERNEGEKSKRKEGKGCKINSHTFDNTQLTK